MKIFITGATGFIGGYLMKRLSDTTYEKVCLVRDEDKARKVEAFGAKAVIGDVTDKASLVAGMSGCDWLINLANIYSFWEPQPDVFQKVNVEGTGNVMEACIENNIKKVVHVSTATVYGTPEELPFKEDTPVGTKRFSTYAESKHQGDLIAVNMQKEKDLPLVVLYPGPVLGAGDSQFTGQMVRMLVQQKLPYISLAFPNTINTFVHVADVAEAIVRAAEKENNISEKYIIGNEKMTMQEFFITIARIAQVPIPHFAPDHWIMMAAGFMTTLANLTKRPPKWGLSLDAMTASQAGVQADGTKAERELGITYRPVRDALKAMIDTII